MSHKWEIGFEWGQVRLRLLPTKAEVRFYGITVGRLGFGVLRQTRLVDGQDVVKDDR